MLGLHKEPLYSLQDKQLVANRLIFKPPMSADSLPRNARKVSCLLAFGTASALKNMNTIEEGNLIMNQVFQTEFGLESIENGFEKYMNTFGKSQNPDALSTYVATLKKMPQNELEPYMECLKEFIASVLKGTFPTMRYTTDNNLHLRTIFNTPSGQLLREKWEKGATYRDIFTMVVTPQRTEKVDVIPFFQNKIIQDRHLQESDYSYLFAILRDPAKKGEIMKQLLENMVEKPRSPDEVKHNQICSFQLQAIRLMYPDNPLPNKELGEKMQNLSRVLKNIHKKPELLPEFDEDLQEIIKSLQTPISRQAHKFDGFVIKDTDDPYQLLSLGRVGGFCQKYEAHYTTSKCLLSYILDGKNRAMIVEDADGNMVARVVIRLLWDRSARKVVLLQETIYPPDREGLITQALNEACKRRAAELNLPLLIAGKTDHRYPNNVESLGGRAPSEYVDAGRGITSNTWTLREVYQVL